MCCAFPFVSSKHLFQAKNFRLQITIFSTRASFRLLLALAPRPLFSPTAWAATVSPTPRYSTYEGHVYSPAFHLFPCKYFRLQIPSFPLAPIYGAGAWRICRFLPRHGLQPLRLLQGTVLAMLMFIPCLSSWRLFPSKYFRLQIPSIHQMQLAPAPGAGAYHGLLSFSPMAWAATDSPALRYTCVEHALFIPFCVI
jgi:hypothetical protein